MDECCICENNTPKELNLTIACNECMSVVHLSCLDPKPISYLKGDNFFQYTCFNCHGDILMERITLPWLTIVQLALYNLSIEDKGCQGYYRFRDICTFIDQNWSIIAPGKVRTTNWRSTTAGVLSTYCPQVFSSGQRQCSMPGWWALAELQPPPQPNQTRTHLKGNLKLKRKHEENIVECKKQNWLENNSPVNVIRTKENISNKKIKQELIVSNIKMEPSDEEYDKKEERIVIPPAFNDIFTTDLKEFENIKEIGNSEMELDLNSVWSTNGLAVTEESNIKEEIQESNGNIQENNTQSLDDKIIDYSEGKPNVLKTISTKRKDDKSDKIIEMRFLNDREERGLINKMKENALSDPKTKRFSRKLKLRILKRSVGTSLFNLDTSVRSNIEKILPPNINIYSNIHTVSIRSENIFTQGKPNNITPGYTHPALRGVNVLDRFKSISITNQHHNTERHLSFMSKLCGSESDLFTKSISSPYTSRVLKPYIRRDMETLPRKVKLLLEITSNVNKRFPHMESPLYKRGSIDYCYVQPLHIPIVNAMCGQFFWPGIDLSECLQYPDFSCIVMYKRLVIGFGFMVPDVKYNEAYISFILVHPDWQHCGIGSFIIYHLIQTCMGKDVTLHVSADNPSMLLYQKFGFKTEGFLLDFYDKYFTPTSHDCRHAFFLRLQR